MQTKPLSRQVFFLIDEAEQIGKGACCGGSQLGACLLPPAWTGRDACHTSG